MMNVINVFTVYKFVLLYTLNIHDFKNNPVRINIPITYAQFRRFVKQ